MRLGAPKNSGYPFWGVPVVRINSIWDLYWDKFLYVFNLLLLIMVFPGSPHVTAVSYEGPLEGYLLTPQADGKTPRPIIMNVCGVYSRTLLAHTLNPKTQLGWGCLNPKPLIPRPYFGTLSLHFLLPRYLQLACGFERPVK